MKDELNLVLVVRWVTQRWRIIALCLLAGGVSGIVYATLAERIYRVEVVIAPSTDNAPSMLAGLSSSLGNLVGLSPEFFGGNESVNESIALLRSRTIAAELIEDEGLLPILFADDYDEDLQEWLVESDEVPTLNDAVELFSDDIRRIHRDRELGLITVGILWRDQSQAADWANQLVRRVNIRMQSRAIDEARGNLDFLQEELESSQNIESRQVISELMQANLNSAAMASAKRDFAFRIVDPALIPDSDDYVSPRRALAVVGFGSLGLVLGVFISAIRPRQVG